jgi:hypothetical protein
MNICCMGRWYTTHPGARLLLQNVTRASDGLVSLATLPHRVEWLDAGTELMKLYGGKSVQLHYS